MKQAGWYKSQTSEGQEVLRWWDGASWTHHTRVLTHEVFRNENDFMFAEPTAPKLETGSNNLWTKVTLTKHHKSIGGIDKLSKKRKATLLVVSIVALVMFAASMVFALMTENNFGKPTDQELLNIDWAASESPNVVNNTVSFNDSCDGNSCNRFILVVGGTDTFNADDFKTLMSKVSSAHTSQEPLKVCLSDYQLPKEFQRDVESYKSVMIESGVPEDRILVKETSACTLFNADGSVY